jgi:hypothetical protein
MNVAYHFGYLCRKVVRTAIGPLATVIREVWFVNAGKSLCHVAGITRSSETRQYSTKANIIHQQDSRSYLPVCSTHS